MNEILEFLKATRTYYLATIDGDKPRVRPFGTVNLFEGKLYIQSGKVKDVAIQLAKNPNIELSAFNGEKWIRLSATAIENNTAEAQASMLEAYPSLKDRYAVGDGNNVVYCLENITATFFSFDSAPKTIAL